MLELSLLANALLVAGLIVVLSRARKRIVEEKCSTFAGCVGAFTSGLVMDDMERRIKTVSFYLACLGGGKSDEEEVKFYLSRAGMLRVFRKPALVDTSEHLRLFGMQNVGDDDEPGNRMLEYISHAQQGDEEPAALWGDELVKANLVAEKKVLNIYQRRITSAPVKIFR